MHYNELQFSPLESSGNFYSLCVVEPHGDTEPLGATDRAVCLVAIAGGSVYALRFADLDSRRRRSPLVASKYLLLDCKNYHVKKKLFDGVVAVNGEVCAIDSLQANGKTYVGLTFSKTARKPDNSESVAYGFALFELVRTDTKKLELNCLFKRSLAYIPSLLTHTKIYRHHEQKLVDVFVSFCFEKNRHDKGCACEVISLNEFQPKDNSHEKEDIRVQYFPEMEQHHLKNVFQGQFVLTNDSTVRLSAWGTDTGCLRVAAVDLHSLDLLASCTLEYDVSILNCRFLVPPGCDDWRDARLRLLVAAVTEPVVVFSGLLSGQQSGSGSSSVELAGSGELDCPAFMCPLDVDEDGEDEVVVGSFCQRVRIYKRQQLDGGAEYRQIFERRFNSPVQCVGHADVTGDGVRELLVLTLNGLHVLQRSRADVEQKLRTRLAELGYCGGGPGGGSGGDGSADASSGNA